MNDSTKTLAKMKKADKLVRLAQRKNGPKSYKRGQGALLRTLLENDGATQRELVAKLGVNRSALKDIVRGKVHNCFIEMSACVGSCIGGPIMEKHHRSPVGDYARVAKYAGSEDFDVQQPETGDSVRRTGRNRSRSL